MAVFTTHFEDEYRYEMERRMRKEMEMRYPDQLYGVGSFITEPVLKEPNTKPNNKLLLLRK